MIDIPRIVTTPYQSTPLKKTKRRMYAAKANPDEHESQHGERRASKRRQEGRGSQIMDRRVVNDRRKGRINLSV